MPPNALWVCLGSNLCLHCATCMMPYRTHLPVPRLERGQSIHTIIFRLPCASWTHVAENLNKWLPLPMKTDARHCSCLARRIRFGLFRLARPLTTHALLRSHGHLFWKLLHYDCGIGHFSVTNNTVFTHYDQIIPSALHCLKFRVLSACRTSPVEPIKKTPWAHCGLREPLLISCVL